MDARTPSLKTIFGQDRRHEIPLYQRPYVWNREEQWAPLWADIKRLAEHMETGTAPRAHFLGAIVLEQLRQPYGDVEKRQVIDGQQRLTTLQLFLEAFADICAQRDVRSFHGALLKLTRNSDPTSADPDEVFKVWPTNLDREAFKTVMNASSPAQLRQEYGLKEGEEGPQIADAYLYFAAEIDSWLSASPHGDVEARTKALFLALRDHLRLVVIDLDHGDDPQLIFETLNARGTPLLPADLVKNFLFRQAAPDGKGIDRVYSSSWQPFDSEGKYWRKKVGRGQVRRPRIDQFLQHFMTMKTGQETEVGRLYQVFREHFGQAGPEEAKALLKELRRYADVYQTFDLPAEQGGHALFFRRLAVMDVTTAHPLLLSLLANVKSESVIEEVLADLESFLIRRMVCQLNTRGYNRLFLDLTNEVRASSQETHAERVRSLLLRSDADSTRWPPDEEFERAWLDSPVYRSLKRTRVRMVLEALERKLRSKKAEDDRVPERLTLEHLLPRKWERHWPLPSDLDQDVAERTRERLLHSFGNLTLLSKRLNPSISNGPWERKRKALKDHTVLRLNIELFDRGAWGEDEILARGKALFRVACRVWPKPEAQRGES